MWEPDGRCRAAYAAVQHWLANTDPALLRTKTEQAERLFRRIGITFSVYFEGGDPERLIPFDVVPRVLDAEEWAYLSAGLEQRVKALNAFIQDVYHEQAFIRSGKMPARLIEHNDSFEPAMRGLLTPNDIYSHIAGIDLVRTGPKDFYVLEDNCRTPSGVSYMLQDREIMMRLFPSLFDECAIEPISHYPDALSHTLTSVAPVNCDQNPTVVLLTPGIYNSAYFEHSFLADEMGIELVEGSDLFVEDDVVKMRTTLGPKRVDVIYRRIDDAFLDPDAFNPDSMLGVRGLMSAFQAGNVTIANAVGAGIADDKAIYVYVPEMIRFYLGEEPILNNVPTRQCSNPEDCRYVLEHLDELVVKEVHGSGGYGMLVGPHATAAQRAEFATKIKADPAAYIAQPTLSLSTCPTFVENGIAPRHVDLRPFVLSGQTTTIVPGGLTRVALKEGSLVVNSSQGGGTKDTWVLSGGEQDAQIVTAADQTQVQG
jgi:uncharacterized circularly permuted ATP-grasp superfamily protein